MELVTYNPPGEITIPHGGTNPGDDEPINRATVSLWESLPGHFRQLGMPLSQAQWTILWSGVLAWDRGLRGDKSASTEANRVFKAFTMTPDSLLQRQISIREDLRAEERAQALRDRAAQVAQVSQPATLTVEVEEKKV